MARILIVEDDAQLRALAESIIQNLGHETTTVGTVEDANKILDGTAQTIDVLFTDLHLNGDRLGGVSVAKHGRNLRHELHVIYVTGDDVTDGTLALVDPHVFLAKPYLTHQVATAISSVLTDRPMSARPPPSGAYVRDSIDAADEVNPRRRVKTEIQRTGASE